MLTSLEITTSCIDNFMHPLNKTSCLNEEVNCTEPSPSVSVPWQKFYDVCTRGLKSESSENEEMPLPSKF
jgi:hypothetical protein